MGNVMEQENAPENEDVEELDMEPLETEEVEAESDSDDASDSDEEVEVNADDEEEELSPSVAAKLEEGEDWGIPKVITDHIKVQEDMSDDEETNATNHMCDSSGVHTKIFGSIE